jgi:hypothetical protein
MALQYIEPAWQDAKDITIADHLATIYRAKNNLDKSITLYGEIQRECNDDNLKLNLLKSMDSYLNSRQTAAQ